MEFRRVLFRSLMKLTREKVVLLANGVAILDELHFVAGDEHLRNLMRQANYFFPREFHERYSALANGAALHSSISKSSVGKGGFCDALNAAPACGRAPIALSPFCTSPGRRRRCAAFRPGAVSKFRALHRSGDLPRSALPSCVAARVASPLPPPCFQSGSLR